MRYRDFIVSLVGPCLALSLVACDGGKPATTAGGDPRPAREKPLVVATTPMVGDLVRSIGGDRIDLVVLIPPGTDPHLWTPTRNDVLQVLDADAVFMNGLMLEGRAGDSFARVEISGRPVVRIAETLPKAQLLTDTSNPSHFDPHIWMDPILWGKTAPPVAELLVRIMPEHRQDFESNAARYIERAKAIDTACAQMLGAIPADMRELVSAHDAFHYFGRRFGLEVRAIQGLSTESEASIADIENLVAIISARKIPVAFIETTVSDRTVRALVEGCASIGHELAVGPPLYSDSLGPAGTPEATWEGMLLHNARVISQSLGGNR